jgi:hypothetical protein
MKEQYKVKEGHKKSAVVNLRLNGEIEKKNQFSKRKKIKRIRIKINIKIKIKIKF